MSEVRSENEDDFDCEDCGLGFITQLDLDRHSLEHHHELPYSMTPSQFKKKLEEYIKKDSRSLDSQGPFGVFEKPIEKSLDCKFCFQSHKDYQSLSVHYKYHHNDESEKPDKWKGVYCSSCNRTFDSMDTLYLHVSLYCDVSYECSICQKSFKKVSDYKIHLDFKHSFAEDVREPGDQFLSTRITTPSFCDICGLSFYDSRVYATHRQIHAPDEKLKCQICCFTTESNEKMKRHVQNIHTHLCALCYKSFNSKSVLGQHYSAQHVNHLQCPLCPVFFVTNNDLMTHLEEHHPSQYLKTPMSCKICFAKFKSIEKFIRHFKNHDDSSI